MAKHDLHTQRKDDHELLVVEVELDESPVTGLVVCGFESPWSHCCDPVMLWVEPWAEL